MVDLKLKEVTKLCLNHYFEDLDGDHKDFILPFRKNSDIKTMNSTFLKKIFSSPTFVADYEIFLSTN